MKAFGWKPCWGVIWSYLGGRERSPKSRMHEARGNLWQWN
jgi:hypothetical protein